MKHIIYTDFTQRKDVDVNLEDFDQMAAIEDVRNKNHTENADRLMKEIKKKFYAYKSQDKLKHKFDPLHHITLEELVEKIYESKLKCYYCNCELLVLYKKRKEGTQWSLERLNNNLGHYESNTCISCLKCNLQRRTDNHEYFKLGKNMQIIKSD